MTEAEKKAMDELCADAKGKPYYPQFKAEKFLRDRLGDVDSFALSHIMDEFLETHNCD